MRYPIELIHDIMSVAECAESLGRNFNAFNAIQDSTLSNIHEDSLLDDIKQAEQALDESYRRYLKTAKKFELEQSLEVNTFKGTTLADIAAIPVIRDTPATKPDDSTRSLWGPKVTQET